MTSPAAAGPPSTTPRTPTWLDRLRSSRGFTPPPAGAAHLNRSIASDPPTLLITPSHPIDAQNNHMLALSKEEDDGVADILYDLFAMGGGRKGETSNCSSNRRKNRRKQLNPKFWDGIGSSNKSSNAASGDHLRRRRGYNSDKEKEMERDDVVVAVNVGSSGDNSLNQKRRKCRDSKIGRDLVEAEAEEDGEVDLKGFSMSEVTVMDSSVEGWKVEMYVFRKRKGRSLWKAREKKSHESRALIPCSRRKRKSAIADYSDDEQEEEEEEELDEEESDGESDRDEELIRKVKKKKKKVVRVSDSDDAALPLINQGQVQGGKVDHSLKGVGCLRGEASLKSFSCSNSHWKSRNGSSSVILVKPMSTFDKIGTKKLDKISVNKGQSLA